MPVSPLWLLSLWFWLASLSSGALWSYGSAFVVLVGVVGETVTELTEWIKPESRKKRVAKISAFILIVGLTGDLLGIRETQLEVASLTKGISDARTSAEGAASAASRAKVDADEARTVANDALGESKEAKDAASIAQQRVKELGKQADELTKRLLAAEATALAARKEEKELADSFAFRTIPYQIGPSEFSTLKELMPFAGTKVTFEVLTDAEARRAADEISKILTFAHWDIGNTVPNPELYAAFNDGVLIETTDVLPGNMSVSVEDRKAERKRDDAADALVAFLHSVNWQARHMRDAAITTPVETVRIVVGFKRNLYLQPDPEWVKKLQKQLDDFVRDHPRP